MQPLDLNLASRPFKNNTLLWVGYSVAALLLIGFSGWSVATYREHESLLRDLRNEVSSIENQTQRLKQRDLRARTAIGKYDLDTLEIQASKANEVIEWKAFSWTRLFNLLEEIQPWDIRMTSIRPIFHGSRKSRPDVQSDPLEDGVSVAVEGSAKTFDDFAKLERVLQQDPAHFRRVEPESILRAETGEILFQLRFLYYPDKLNGKPEEAVVASAEEEP